MSFSKPVLTCLLFYLLTVSLRQVGGGVALPVDQQQVRFGVEKQVDDRLVTEVRGLVQSGVAISIR